MKIKTNIEIKNNKLTTCIFFTPEVHKIINSLSRKCFNMNIVKVSKNDKGINFGIKKRFNREYLK